MKFSRYAAAAAAAGAASVASTSNADFSSPYQLTPPPASTYTGANVDQTFGAWTGAATATSNVTVNTSNAPSSLFLGFGNPFSGIFERLDFTAPVAGTGLLSFNWSFTQTGPGSEEFGYTVNGVFTSLAVANSASATSIAVNAGDVFGFRLLANYDGNSSVTISNFSAPVPEPSVAVLVVAGALGLMALRELRRRRQNAGAA
jgi:hypothetical protein